MWEEHYYIPYTTFAKRVFLIPYGPIDKLSKTFPFFEEFLFINMSSFPFEILKFL
jgi:hypothetical protein